MACQVQLCEGAFCFALTHLKESPIRKSVANMKQILCSHHDSVVKKVNGISEDMVQPVLLSAVKSYL